MAPLRLGRERILQLAKHAADRLPGEWLIVGGSAAAVWFSPGRSTEDIDMIGLGGTNDERLSLMQLAHDEGLAVEVVNSAADFFVRRVEGWRDELVVLIRGRSSTVYRPTPTLFLLLKLGRLTAVDLDDCLTLLAHCRDAGEPFDAERVRAALTGLAPTRDEALRARRDALLDALR